MKVGWPNLSQDYERTAKHLRTLSRKVDSEAESIQLKAKESKNVEMLEALNLENATPETKRLALPCYFLPSSWHDKPLGREDVLQSLQAHLNPRGGEAKHKAMVLYGMGGVGKTRIAFEYCYQNREGFDAIFWIRGDSTIKLSQSFVEASRQLKLLSEDDSVTDAAYIVTEMRRWLSSTSDLAFLRSCRYCADTSRLQVVTCI